MTVPAPTVAAITLHEEGGGVATASRLFWRVCAEQWGSAAQLITLDRGATASRGTSYRWTDRVSFGLDVLAKQLSGSAGGVLFAHPALARAQAYVPRRLRRPYVVFLHGIEVWRPLDADMRDVLRGAAMLIANSAFTAARAREHTPALGEIEVCPLTREPGDDGDTLAEPTTARRVSHEVLIVGRLDGAERYKGHDELIAAWPEVVASVPDAKLVVVGDGDDRPRLEAAVAARGLGGHVHFTGFVPTSARQEHYRRAGLFAMPSRGEGFGLVYLEAMAHGLACIGSTHDAAGEVIVDHVTGRLLDMTRPDELARVVVALLNDDEQRKQMGRRGQAREREVFGYERFARRLSALLERAFDASPSPVDQP